MITLLPMNTPLPYAPDVETPEPDEAKTQAYSDEMVASLDRAASFSPWHGLVAHQPLGSINRIRRAVYEASARFRLSRNGCHYHGMAAQ